jgi:hypothetical protein
MSHIPINFHGRFNPPLLLFQDLEPRSITLTKKIPIERAIILGQKAVLLSLETPFSYSNPHIQWWLSHVKPPFQVVGNLSLSLKSHKFCVPTCVDGTPGSTLPPLLGHKDEAIFCTSEG